MAIEKLSVILELVSGNYKKEAKEAATATSGISGAAKGVTGSLKAMVGPAAIGAAIVGMVRFATAAGENADRLFDLQAQTGLTTEAIQEWEFVAEAAGATTEVFSDAVKAVIRNLDETEGATGAASEAYEKLGISVFDASGKLRDAGGITDEVFVKLADMENITARNAIAQDIFGKKWEETISVLDLGGEAIGELRDEAQASIISERNLRQADQFRETMDKLKVAAEAAATKGLAVFLPLLIGIANELEESAGLFGQAVTFFDELAIAAGNNSAEAQEVTAAYDETNGALAFLGFGIEDTLEFFAMLGVELQENRVETEAAATAAQFMAFAVKDDLNPVVFDSIDLINRQGTAFSNAASAADTQRTAMINLANYQASQLTPIANMIRLQQELETAQETLTTAQKDSKTPADELALAQIGVAEALLAVQAGGLALEGDQIQAFANLLITQFGYSEDQALETLEAMNLLDGWEGEANFRLNMDTIVSGPGVPGNFNSDTLKFASGGMVPGWRGQPQLILAHGGEVITPANAVTNNKTGPTINVYSPTNNMAADLQYASILSNLETLVS